MITYVPSNTGIGLLTYRQACTLMKIIAWACKHEDCGVTQDEAKELCTAIQYRTNTRPKEVSE